MAFLVGVDRGQSKKRASKYQHQSSLATNVHQSSAALAAQALMACQAQVAKPSAGNIEMEITNIASLVMVSPAEKGMMGRLGKLTEVSKSGRAATSRLRRLWP